MRVYDIQKKKHSDSESTTLIHFRNSELQQIICYFQVVKRQRKNFIICFATFFSHYFFFIVVVVAAASLEFETIHLTLIRSVALLYLLMTIFTTLMDKKPVRRRWSAKFMLSFVFIPCPHLLLSSTLEKEHRSCISKDVIVWTQFSGYSLVWWCTFVFDIGCCEINAHTVQYELDT